jgi:hypothetical protein
MTLESLVFPHPSILFVYVCLAIFAITTGTVVNWQSGIWCNDLHMLAAIAVAASGGFATDTLIESYTDN